MSICLLSNLLQNYAYGKSNVENVKCEVSASEPKEVSDSEPREVSASEPREVSASEPGEVSASEPREVSASEPREVSVSEPKNKYETKQEFKYDKEATKKEMDKIVLSTIEDMKEDALLPYKSYYKKSVDDCKLVSKYLLDTYNYSQTELNAQYQKEYGSKVSGTCSEVACTSIAEYYTRKRFAKTLGYNKYKNIFNSMILLGYGIGAYDGMGTDVGSIYKIVNSYYTTYGFKGYGTRKTISIRSNISDYNKKKKPVLGSFVSPKGEGHSMVVAGIYELKITYKKTSKSKQKSVTVYYYAVNDGWYKATSGDNKISYIDEKYLKNGITIFK